LNYQCVKIVVDADTPEEPSVNYAAVMGLFQDTHINTNQFSLLALVFYVTYLFFELPTGYLMQRFPTAKYLGANVIFWGICVTTNSACKNFGSLIAVRVLLGCFESAVAPALILITGMWYKKSEQPPVREHHFVYFLYLQY